MKELANMIILAKDDNVGVALRGIAPGEFAVDGQGSKIKSVEDVPLGHKIALKTIAEGDKIVRFGLPVGIARAPIGAGRLVHIHNVRSQYLDNDEDHYE
jgi:altronate dehydratase small subunit